MFEPPGRGETSRALRALTKEGGQCVIKMYVRKFEDGGKKMNKNGFESAAKQSVAREVEAYHLVYPELKEHV